MYCRILFSVICLCIASTLVSMLLYFYSIIKRNIHSRGKWKEVLSKSQTIASSVVQVVLYLWICWSTLHVRWNATCSHKADCAEIYTPNCTNYNMSKDHMKKSTILLGKPQKFDGIPPAH